MGTQNYFSWLSEQGSRWTNDSALMPQITAAVEKGAIGATTNPPLSFEALSVESEIYGEGLAKISRQLSDDDFAIEAMGLVVRKVAAHFLPMHREKGGMNGCVRAQVAPSLRDDAEGMLAVGKRFAAWGENVMVKIPVTGAGLWALEELAALGIPTNPTVGTSVAQLVAAAEAFERGAERAKKAGIQPAWSSAAFVIGRAQDYFVAVNEEQKLGIDLRDIEWCGVALIKRALQIYKERGFQTVLQPAAFRCALQVEQIAGGQFCATIHPKVQKQVEDAEANGELRRQCFIDAPIDEDAVARVAKALPAFVQAYEPDALKPEEFLTFGPTVMTLDGFDKTGWQKIISLR